MKKAGKEILRSPRQASALPWSRRQRLRYLEALAYWKGSFRRADLLDRFDIGIQRVSDDIQEYLRRNPEALVYDRNEKLYRATTDMKPIFGQVDLEEALGLLGKREAAAGPWFDRVTLPARQMKPRVLQLLFRAVATNRSIHVRYASLNSATFRWRWLTPHAFAHDGYRWHVRAFCHEERKFKDFVIGRISDTDVFGEPAASARDDLEWTKIARLQLTAAPTLSESELRALQLDFGLSGRRLTVPIRAALALYAFAQLGLDPRGKSIPGRFGLGHGSSGRD